MRAYSNTSKLIILTAFAELVLIFQKQECLESRVTSKYVSGVGGHTEIERDTHTSRATRKILRILSLAGQIELGLEASLPV